MHRIFAIDTLYLNHIMWFKLNPWKSKFFGFQSKKKAKKKNFPSDWSVVLLALFMKSPKQPCEFSALLLDLRG